MTNPEHAPTLAIRAVHTAENEPPKGLKTRKGPDAEAALAARVKELEAEMNLQREASLQDEIAEGEAAAAQGED